MTLSAGAQTRSGDATAGDFYALGSDGRPVADVKAEEVQLKIDGRARPVTSLEWVPVAEAPSSGTATPPAIVRPPFGSNAEMDGGRSFVLTIENDSSGPAVAGW